jgi:hypothetical protein
MENCSLPVVAERYEGSMSRWIAVAAALVLGLLAMPALAEDYVVIASTVPALAKGATLAAGATLDIPANGRVVLISASGKVLTLSGPFKGPPPAAEGGASGGNTVSILATLVGKADQRQAIGAVRALDSPWRVDGVKTPSQAMAIDATNGGDVCLFDPAAAEIMHDPAAAGAMTVQSMNSGAEATLTWPKGVLRQKWPAKLALADGDMLAFEQPGHEQAAMVTVHILPPAPGASPAERAVAMAKAGCDDQARLLLSIIAKAAK